MRKSLFLFCPLLTVISGFVLLKSRQTATIHYINPGYMQDEIISCGFSADGNYIADPTGKFIRLLPGRGDHRYAISTKSDSAQLYFNQGLTMFYSYHMREAVASFREAARFDSSCAMIYWGQALAMGPTFNFGYRYKMNVKVPAALDNMNRFAPGASDKEKDLLTAMNSRYDATDVADKKRKQLNLGWIAALKPLVNKYPEDIDIKALYTDAVMVAHPWEFWNNDGTPKPWTPELVQYCRDILVADPHHPAGLHYYIHVTEASRHPDVALPSADSLIKLFPGIAHMVHMSSHEYERIGYYAQGVDANEKADESLVLYDSLAKGLYTQVHAAHYFEVDAYCAMSGAMYQKSRKKSMAVREISKPDKSEFYDQYEYIFPELAMVRLGKWKEILQDTTTVKEDWYLASLLLQFCKGMASARTSQKEIAESYLKHISELLKETSLKEKLSPFASSPYEIGLVAESLLRANILFESKSYGAAIAAVKSAIQAEDRLLYSEPPMWLLPARQYLGAFYMKLKKYAEAESTYRQDLVWNPGNGWSLLGLHNALQAQGKTKELKKLKTQYMGSFSKAELLPTGSAY